MAAFGQGSEGAMWTVGFLLEKILALLAAWSGEEKTLIDVLQLLVTLVDHRIRWGWNTQIH